MFVNCSECGKAIATNDIKYHTPAVEGKIQHAFCNAYCSHTWYVKNRHLGKKDDNDVE